MKTTYPGDCTADFPADKLLGYHGRHYLPASATYDSATDRTTVELRKLTEAEMVELSTDSRVETIDTLLDLVCEEEDRLRVAGLFGGPL